MSRHAAAALIIVSAASAADAHPIHEVVQGAYITLAPGRLALQLDLTPGRDVARQFVALIDRDGDGRLSQTEGRAFAEGVLRRMHVEADGRPAVLRFQAVSLPSAALLAASSGAVKVEASATIPGRAAIQRLTFRNAYAPAESRCFANIFLRGGGYRVLAQAQSQDGRDLSVKLAVEG